MGRFPGKATIEQLILTLERLLSNDDSFDFFKQVVDKKDDYLDLEEDYRDIHEFSVIRSTPGNSLAGTASL